MLTKKGREGKGGERCSVYVGKKNVRKAENHREGIRRDDGDCARVTVCHLFDSDSIKLCSIK